MEYDEMSSNEQKKGKIEETTITESALNYILIEEFHVKWFVECNNTTIDTNS